MIDGTRKIAKNHAKFAIKMRRANKMFSPSWKWITIMTYLLAKKNH